MTRPPPFPGLAPARWSLAAEELDGLLSPALLIDLGLVRANVRRVIALCGSPERWRPHVKTTKTPAVFAELLAAGVRHFKCATLREARCLLQTARALGHAIDLVVAYPLVAPALGELARLAAEHPEARLAVLAETPALARAAPDAVGVLVDVDPGMHRTGVPLEDRTAIRAVAQAAGARFRGLHHYAGHLHGPDDERRERCHAGYRELVTLADELARAGCAPDELVTSGTPAFRHALGFEGFVGRTHRVSPGTVVLHDLRSEEENPTLGRAPAAVVLARVVSRPRADVVTCDAGSKSLAAEAGDPCALVLDHPGLVAERPSEEHLPLRVDSGPAPERGTALFLVPRHVCPTVNLAEEAVLVEDGKVRASVPVAARAHDVWVGR
jgi:D-serine deaminase-like pyridoxal phosphate-dependent protein